MAFAIDIAFKAASDIEGLFVTGRRQRNGRGAAARARTAQQQHGIGLGGARSAQRLGCFRKETGILRASGKTLPFDAMDPAAQVFQVGQADEIPFCHGPHVDQLGLGVALQAVPSLGGADIAGIVEG